MKTCKIEMTIYEVGDVLDVSKTEYKHHHYKGVDVAERCIVIDVKPTKEGYLYKVITNERTVFLIKSNLLFGETYIDHVDMSVVFGDDPSTGD